MNAGAFAGSEEFCLDPPVTCSQGFLSGPSPWSPCIPPTGSPWATDLSRPEAQGISDSEPLACVCIYERVPCTLLVENHRKPLSGCKGDLASSLAPHSSSCLTHTPT